MIKHYFMQALSQLRQQPIIGVVNVLGTMLAIFLIMLVVMIQQVKVAPFPPESNRDRLLHVQGASIVRASTGNGIGNGGMSVQTAKECYKSLETPEAVSIYSGYAVTVPVSIPKKPAISSKLLQTDEAFWQIFNFTFIDGSPYDKAIFEAGQPVAVITERIARALFGMVTVVGKEFQLNYAPYRVIGVVKDVSTLANTAYSQIWIPYTSTDIAEDTWVHGHMGAMSVVILAYSQRDFAAIRQEAKKKLETYNAILEKEDYKFIDRNRPYDQEKQSIAFGANWEPDLRAERCDRIIVLLVLLFIPAINLGSMTQSRLRQRVSEIGIRRAFGCTRLEIMGRIIMENFIVTLLAGVLGLLFSLGFAYWGADFLFMQPFSDASIPTMVNGTILFHISTFLYALLFCFILNLLNSGIPAWRASKIGIVKALAGKLH
mgnify:FL=1